jgi:hypothetical protein
MKKKINRDKSSVDTGLHVVKKSVDELFKTVYQGNGKPSVITQLANLETQVKTLSKDIESLDGEIRLRIVDVGNHVNDKVKGLDANMGIKIRGLETEMALKFKNITDVVTEKFKSLSDQINQEFNRETAVLDKKWNFRTAVTTGVLASFTSICVVLITEFLKKLH